MAAQDLYSSTLTGAYASPSVYESVRNSGGREHIRSETYAVVAGDEAGDRVRMFKVKSSDSAKSLVIFWDDIAGLADVNVGLYDTNDGAAVSASLFADAFNITAAASTVGTEIRFQNSNINTINQQIWELLGLAADPHKEYDVVVLLVDEATGGGDISLVMRYTCND